MADPLDRIFVPADPDAPDPEVPRATSWDEFVAPYYPRPTTDITD